MVLELRMHSHSARTKPTYVSKKVPLVVCFDTQLPKECYQNDSCSVTKREKKIAEKAIVCVN